MKTVSKLALLGGEPTIKTTISHDAWPPNASLIELFQIALQRNRDIGIKGRVGPIKELEENFLDFLERKVDFCVSFNSGTSALLAAYFACGIEPGDEVLGPALTYHAALSPVFILGGKVRLVDINPKTRCIDVEKIEESITEKTKVITVVHQWGHPADMDRIIAIAKKHNIKVIEDCSHAHGSKYKNMPCGTIGDIGVFSLQTKKAVFAGEGGLLVTNDPELHDRATLLGHYRDRSKENVILEEYRNYWVTGFGLKLRMSPFNAIVAINSLNRYSKIKQGRHQSLEYLKDQLDSVAYIEPPYVSEEVDMGAWYGFKPLYLKQQLKNISRSAFIEAARAEGLQINAPSGPSLATLPLYNQENTLMNSQPHYVNQETVFDQAMFVQNSALSFPSFYQGKKDFPIIDKYIEALHKITENAETLKKWSDENAIT